VSDELGRRGDERRAWRTDQEWSHLRTRIETADPLREPRRWPRWIAAAAAVVIAIAGIRWSVVARRSEETRSVTTASGDRLVLRLADSSVVTLGPASTVRYRMSGTRREVDVDGLAAFTVVHDARRPFVVRAKNAQATDLGTRFVVRAYAADSGVEVAVTSGVVGLSGLSRSTLVLQAGEAGRVSPAGLVSAVARARTASDTAWIDGRLAFDDEPLERVALELERWFDVEIRISDSTLARRRVSAVYNNPSLSGVVEALATTFDARVARTGRVVTFSPRTR
jgi:transmembrane sensor